MKITDTLPAPLSYVSKSDGGFTGTRTGNTIVWTAPSVPAFGTAGYEGDIYLTVFLTSTAHVGDIVSNTLTSSVAEPEAYYDNNSYTHTGTAVPPIKDIYIMQSKSKGGFTPGGDVEYAIYYNLLGKYPATNVLISDTLRLG